MTIFEGSAVALVLPMFDNGDIDFEGFKKQVQRMIDGGVQALLVNGTTGETATITIEDEFKLLDLTLELAKGTGVKVICGAGASLMKVAREAMKRSLAGVEFASGIPGTIGGAIYMNAGAYKSDMGYITTNVTVLTNDLKMDFHYRSSYLQKHKDYICLEAVLKLTKGDRKEIEEITKERRERRMESQPLEYPSAGSVFRNPEGMYAGKLIEDLGLKGLTKGGAEVSLKHANFVINKDGATARNCRLPSDKSYFLYAV